MLAALIIMSRSGSEEAAVSCLKRGAHDYITKSNLNSTFLRQVVTSALESYRLQQDLLKRQIELEQINKELGNKDKLKTHFVASASHELRTPVSAMFGLMDMLETTDLDSQQRRLMADLRACGESLLLTVDDVIDLARVESGIIETRAFAFELSEELQESLRPLRVLARDKNLILECHLSESIAPWRLGDRGRIRQILNNLVGNAIKYCDSGRVDIRVEEGEGSLLTFSVTDTGIGVTKEDQQRIFEPFFQADRNSEGHKSSGLGLATCVQLVKALNGNLELESEPNVGSIFKFSIPLPETDPPKSESPASSEKETGKETVTTNSPHLHVLLAEDNPIISAVLQAQLEGRNYTVTTVPDGVKALRALKTENIDIVLMDCQMPNAKYGWIRSYPGFTASIESHHSGYRANGRRFSKSARALYRMWDG